MCPTLRHNSRYKISRNPTSKIKREQMETLHNIRGCLHSWKKSGLFITLFVVVLSSVLDSAEGSVYPAITRYPSAVNYWASGEVNFMEKLETYLRNLEKSSSSASSLSSVNETLGDVDAALSQLFMQEVDSYLSDYKDSCRGLRGFQTGNATDKIKALATNPVAAYRLLRRVIYLLPGLLDRIANVNGYFGSQDFAQFFPNRQNVWPRVEDLQDAMMGILRVNRVYDMDLNQFANGNISGVVTGAKLQGVHCYEIGLYAHTENFHNLAIEWLELALAKAKLDKTLELPLIKAALSTAISKHDEQFDSRLERDPYFYDQKLIPISNNPSIRRKSRDVLIEKYKGQKDWSYNDVNFWALCSKGSFQSEAVKAKLFCWNEVKIHPTWLIGPLKVELLATDPDVFQVYDVIGDKKIARIKEAAQPTMHLSRVVDNDSKIPGATTYSRVRTSVGTWLEESDDPILRPIPHHIEQITGLKVVPMTSSEMLQVASYTFSGHYEVHLDALITPLQYGELKGDRIATFMYYLTDVELGGKTAFVQAGAVASPVKGSAVFWYDVHRDGQADYWTYHGACPVVLGQKWVSNKWIRILDQFKTHTCSPTDQKERFRIRVNGKIPNVDVNVNQTEEGSPSASLSTDGISVNVVDNNINVDAVKHEL